MSEYAFVIRNILHIRNVNFALKFMVCAIYIELFNEMVVLLLSTFTALDGWKLMRRMSLCQSGMIN
eukprot:3713665-Ditylum_brightwellii.AAC.1